MRKNFIKRHRRALRSRTSYESASENNGFPIGESGIGWRQETQDALFKDVYAAPIDSPSRRVSAKLRD